jgi:hypothetical protein
MVISYVRLNRQTLNCIAYILPRIPELLARASTATVFSKLDLVSSFYQIRMRELDVEKAAFATPLGNNHFKVMTMGLTEAPGTFQHAMEQAFAKPALVSGQSVDFMTFVCIHLDDLRAYSVNLSKITYLM